MSAIGIEAWTNLLRSHARLMRELDEELQERHAVSLGDFDVFAQLDLAPDGCLRMCDLADAVVLSPSGLSRRVDRLERAGLVERRRAAADARSVEARLSADGKRLFRRLRKTHLTGVEEHFGGRFSERELERLRDLLARLTAAPAEPGR
ncbi:MAG: MarR family transcriptional regulator [Actinomycetota bacterium]|nr:MarR family transcriptional regulator [Actinomycetota bacterium]